MTISSSKGRATVFEEVSTALQIGEGPVLVARVGVAGSSLSSVVRRLSHQRKRLEWGEGGREGGFKAGCWMILASLLKEVRGAKKGGLRPRVLQANDLVQQRVR